jgi:hypothetical protein
MFYQKDFLNFSPIKLHHLSLLLIPQIRPQRHEASAKGQHWPGFLKKLNEKVQISISMA